MQHVLMLRGTVGEDGTDWQIGETHLASPAFARWLVDRKKARPAPVQAPAAEGGDPVPVSQEEKYEPNAGLPRPRRARKK